MTAKASIGAIECKSISQGLTAANELTKASEVELIYCKAVCPRRLLAIVAGGEAEINAAIAYGENICGSLLIDSFTMHAVAPEIIAGFKHQFQKFDGTDAFGVLETKTVCSGLEALDQALKAGDLELASIKMAQTISGKFVAVVAGSLSSVEYGLAAAAAKAGEQLIQTNAIAAPSQQLLKFIAHI